MSDLFKKSYTWIVLFLISRLAKLFYYKSFILFFNLTQKDTVYFLINYILVNAAFSIFLLSLKKRRTILVFYFLEVLYLIANYNYITLFQTYPLFSHVFSSWKEGAEVLAKGGVPFYWVDLFFLIDLPFLFLLLKKSTNYRSIFLTSTVQLCSFSFFLAFLFILPIALAFSGKYPWKMPHSIYHGPFLVVRNYGLISLQITSLFNNEEQYIKQLDYNLERATSYAFPQQKNHPNFIMIQVETLDAQLLNAYHNGKPIMPFLKELSSQSIFYPYTLCYHYGGKSSDTEFSSMNGIEPLLEYNSFKLMDYDYPNSLVRLLRERGYETLAFHNNKKDYFNRGIAYAKMGYKDFFDINSMKLKEGKWGAADDKMLEFVTRTLTTQRSPFFAQVITMSSHEPHNYYPSYFDDPSYDDISDEQMKLLFKSFSYVDQTLTKYIPLLQKIPNTYIFIYGDHSAYTIDERYADPVSKVNFRKCSFMVNANSFECIPLIVITPEGKIYREEAQVASTLDFSPTILKLSGVAASIKSGGNPLTFSPSDDKELIYNGTPFKRSFLFQEAKSLQIDPDEK